MGQMRPRRPKKEPARPVMESKNDPLGSYTGTPIDDEDDQPTQDADDL